MKINLREKVTDNKVKANILQAVVEDMPLIENGWKFDWRKYFQSGKNLQFYKVVLSETPNVIEAVASFSYTDYGMFYMNLVEASPHNRSSTGKYEAVGALIAFGCSLSFENLNSGYFGVLGFHSKTDLIHLYQRKYFAKLYPNHLMAIEPPDSQIVINFYL